MTAGEEEDDDDDDVVGDDRNSIWFARLEIGGVTYPPTDRLIRGAAAQENPGLVSATFGKVIRDTILAAP